MILCSGEALIDMLPRTTAAGEPAFSPYAGGAVFNTAVALGRLGAPTGFFSGFSSDFFGELLLDHLAKSQVSPDYVLRTERPCTIAFVRLVNGQATYAFYDENTAGRMLTTADLPEIDDRVTAMFFGGISLMVEPCGSAYEALMLREAPRRVTMLDPNIRPDFIKDPDAYRARTRRLLAAADIVKMSDEDMDWLLGPGDSAVHAAEIHALGPRLICMTEGAKGVTGYTPSGAVTVPAQRVEVVDTVGAGDTFNAGVLAALHEAGALTKTRVAALTDDEVRAALDLGVRAAAVTVSRAGANPPFRHEI